ncbi:4-oxalocrotonate tautomerase [Pararhizobium capsulatum DSM 1112]|uniref:4-oxalocrotonate tautomerase n=1 Tax=Pararhizobium capsulatum DSM 1112 TaxID=1121113 RepID=A0ABU0BZG1_9HYPH|nr:tautomerase family protein [Pararhizobium capsulatum]MDQ0323652.1 4-oxalocrotonate tautomerase [Pararhizobium capsulatum DSM 1112]
MPFVHIQVAGAHIGTGEKQQLQKQATSFMVDIMRKRPDVTAVLVDVAEPGSWAIGGEPATVAAHLDVKVTRGTNTHEEKARFVAEVAAMFRKVLGPDLPIATYVVVDEIEADAWGYDGVTQEERRLLRPQADAAETARTA